jgi:hypothetical protein
MCAQAQSTRFWEPGASAAHLEDLSTRLELVAFVPVGEEVNGLAHMVPGVLDLKTAQAEQVPVTSEQP